jgi:hypothetical protein
MSLENGPERPIDQERLAHSSQRYESQIHHGILEARLNHREIDLSTARMIATSLGRALGRASALAEFGRSGVGDQDAMRDEYLLLDDEALTPPQVKAWIGWFGTFLISSEAGSKGRQSMNETIPPRLELVLIRDQLVVKGELITVWLPADLDRQAVAKVASHLEELNVLDDAALRAFVSLPDVNAAHEVLMESFHASLIGTYPDMDQALRAVTELTAWEMQLRTFAVRRGIDPVAVSIDRSILTAQAKFAYEFVELDEGVHVFHK